MRNLKTILFAVAAFCASQHAAAQDTLYWLGAVSTEWTETDNWSQTRGGSAHTSIPTGTTAVIIPGGTTFTCVLDANASINSLDLESGATLDADGFDLDLAGHFTQLGGTFYGRASAISISGELLIVTGDFHSTTGTLEIGGGINEQNYESFKCTTGTVKLTSSGEIDLSSFLYNLEVATGIVATLQNHTPIMNNLVLNGTINTNSKVLYIDNPLSGGISGSGGIHIGGEGDLSLVIWRTAEETGSYSIPLLSSLTGSPIPFDFTITSGGSGEEGRILLTTLPTGDEKPQVPFEPLYYINGSGGDNSDFNSNRIWMLLINDYDVSPVITASFSYTDSDIDVAGITESQIKAQRKTESGAWEAPSGTVDAPNNLVTVTGIEGSLDEAQIWTLVDNSSPNATPDKLYWLGEESADWGDEFNWTYVEGTPTITGRAPDGTCEAVITAGGNFDCILDANVEVGGLLIDEGAIFDVDVYDLEVTGDFTQLGGTFYGRSSSVKIGGLMLVVDGEFNSTSATLELSGGAQEQTPGSIKNNNGTVRAADDMSLDIFSQLYNLVVPAGVTLVMDNFSSVANSVVIDGVLELNATGIGISNPSNNAMSGTGGIYFDGGDDIGIVYWEIGEGTGTYRIPVLSTSNGPVIPFDIEVPTAGEGEDGGVMFTTISAYDPLEPKPMDLIEGYPFTNQYGTDNSRMTANRLWSLGMGMFDVMPEVNLAFGYDDLALANTDINEVNLKVQGMDFELPWFEPAGIVDVPNRKVTLTGNTWEDEVAQFFVLVDGTSPNRNVNALYWTGADDNDWSNGLNWSWTPCGASADTIPDSTMTVVFTGCDSTYAQLSADVTVKRLVYMEETPAFVDEGVFILSVLEEVVIYGSEVSVTSGIINFNSDLVIQNSSLSITGGAEISINGNFVGEVLILTLDGNIGVTGEIVLNGSSIEGQGQITATEMLLNKGSGLYAFEGDLSILGNLIAKNSSIGLGSDELTVSGNVSILGESSVRLTDGTVQVNGNFVQNGGYFDGNHANLSVGGDFEVYSGEFRSTKEQLSVSGDFTVASSAFHHNEGKVLLLGDEKVIDLGLNFSTQDILLGASPIAESNQDGNVKMEINEDGTVSLAPIIDENIDGVSTLDLPLVNGVDASDMGFYDLTLGNNSFKKVCASDIYVNGTIDFDGDFLDLGGRSLTINNSLATAVEFSSGGVLAAAPSNNSWVRWNVGEETGAYTIPLVNAAEEHLDFYLDITTAGVKTNELLTPFISINSFVTDGSMQPYAEGVTYWYNENGDIDFTNIVPRVWQLRAGNYASFPLGDIHLRYTDTDIQGISFDESSLKVQSWLFDGWEPAEGTLITSTNTLTLSSRLFNGTMVMVNGVDFLLGKLTTVSYADLADELDGGYYHTMNSHLYFRYDNPYADGQVSLKIFDWKRDLELNTTINVTNGTNWSEYNLGNLGLTEGNFYVAEVTDPKGRITKLRFKYVIDVTIVSRPDPYEPVQGNNGGGN